MDGITREFLAVAPGIPDWISTDFVHNLSISGTGMKKYNASVSGIKTWMLTGKRKIYKDRYGWISASWSVHPSLRGNKWVVESSLSFAPATSGSFATEKFSEFKKAVSISGRENTAIFNIWDHILTEEPGRNADGDVQKLVALHGRDLKKAKAFWKKRLAEAKKQLGLVSSDDTGRNRIMRTEEQITRELLAVARDLVGGGREAADLWKNVAGKLHTQLLRQSVRYSDDDRLNPEGDL